MTVSLAMAAVSDVTAPMVSHVTLKLESARRCAHQDTMERIASWVRITDIHKVCVLTYIYIYIYITILPQF